MATPSERARSLVWAGAFLVELNKDETLSLSIRRAAAVIARHFPTTRDIKRMSSAPFPDVEMGSPADLVEWLREYPHGPLLDATRLRFPEERPLPKSKRKRTD
ncbi:BPSL0761 family protein [Rhodanobacter umsongensis]